MKKIRKERKHFSPNKLTKWKEGDTLFREIFKQGVSKKRFSSNFSFFW